MCCLFGWLIWLLDGWFVVFGVFSFALFGLVAGFGVLLGYCDCGLVACYLLAVMC